MDTDKIIKEENTIQEANYVYKAIEFGLTRPLPTLINTKNQHKLINAVVKNDKLSNKEKITELRKLKTKFKGVKTWRVSHGNLVPVVDKAIKEKICNTALDKIDKVIEKLGGVEEDYKDLNRELCESTIELLEDEANRNRRSNNIEESCFVSIEQYENIVEEEVKEEPKKNYLYESFTTKALNDYII